MVALPLTRTITVNGITFSYPESWRAQRLTEVSSFTSLLATVSTRPIPEPCHAVPNGADCGPLLHRIGPTDALVSWTQEGMPGRTLAQQPGQRIDVDGHPASLGAGHICPPGTAAELDGLVSLVQMQSHDELLHMTACAGTAVRDVAMATARAMFNALRLHQHF